jgi:hypothetical protein
MLLTVRFDLLLPNLAKLQFSYHEGIMVFNGVKHCCPK